MMGDSKDVGYIELVQGSLNPYADMDLPDAEEMLLKARLVDQISDRIQASDLSVCDAAILSGMPESSFSRMLLGHFHDIDRGVMIESLKRLNLLKGTAR